MSRGSRGTRYGARHEAARRRAIATFVPGQPCAIGGEPLRTNAKLHLAHNEAGTGYLGLACAEHNLGAAGKLTGWDHRRRGAAQDPDPRPVDWMK